MFNLSQSADRAPTRDPMDTELRWPALLPATLVAGAVLFLSTVWARAEPLLVESSEGPIALEKIASFEHPWGMDFLPDGRLLVTERDGALYLLETSGEARSVNGVPDVYARGQGGLLDVAVSPDFAESGLIYLTYAAETADGDARTAADRAVLQLDGTPRLADSETLFEQVPALSGGRHFGARVVVAPDGTLFITTGDRGERDLAQDPFNHVGKVIRITPEGAIPEDNPFADGEMALAEIWSTGHRNIQGAVIDPQTGALWTIEHGARGGDELNLPLAGLNYGWPVISYGVHYSGAPIGDGVAAPGYEQPVHYWDPSIAPSGLAIYQGDLFDAWRGDFFVGALKDRLVARVRIEDGVVVEEEHLFEREIGRIRDVAVGPGGALWLLTDEADGGVWRVTPAD